MQLVVLTGGPCAGKTTVLESLWKTFGYRIITLPEMATYLLKVGIYPPPNPWSQEWQDGFQKVIISSQLSAEEIAIANCAIDQDIRVVVCDRGILDGAAYVPGGPEEFCKKFNCPAVNVVCSRYDLVIHLESLTTINPDLYLKLKDTNPQRFESLDEARMREYAVRDAWKDHRHRIHLAGEISETNRIVTGIIKSIL